MSGSRSTPLGKAPARRHELAALGAIALAIALLYAGLAHSSAPVVIDDDGLAHRLRTHAGTVGEVLREAGLALYPEDRVSPAVTAGLQPGQVIRIQRARPAQLTVGGETRRVRTHATTAGDLLSEMGAALGPADELWLNGRHVGLDAALGGAVEPSLLLKRALTLTLDDGGVTRTLHTTAVTVGEVLQAYQVTLYPQDLVTPTLEAPLSPQVAITIWRSVPVSIRVDGRTVATRTRAGTVAGVLGQEGIALVGRDTVEPALETPIGAGMAIRITRVREEMAVELEPIPFDLVWVSDPEVEIDSIRLAQAGQEGMTKRRFRVTYEDNEETGRSLEDVWVDRVPVTKTMAYGTKIVVRTLDTPDGPIEYWRKMRVYTTSYCARTAGRDQSHPRYGYTRLGWKLTKGIVAVDPEVIPLRSKLYVPGYGFATAGDTGVGVKGRFVDLGFDDHNYQSWHWWTDVYLLTPVPPSYTIRWVLPDWPRYPDRKRR